ncbi:MAG: PQQ-dependent sugar dehydrogenase [Minisyncoccia bacterium]
MKKIILIIIIVILLIFGIKFYTQNLRGIWPLVKTPNTPIAKLADPTIYKNLNLNLPPNFSISIFAQNIPGARVMAFDNSNNIWVSQTSQGKISELILNNGEIQSQKVIFSGLRNPHGLAFDPENPNILYIAEETQISKVTITPTVGKLQKIIDLPAGSRHFTRTLGFGPDGKLYVSIGSTCDVCNESDPRIASIYSLNKDGSNFKQLAKGLRNSVFFTFNKNDGKIWATEMGHDYLGDNIPPDEINTFNLKSSTTLNYGWPICYGQNIHDTTFDKNTYIRNPCMIPFEIPSFFDIQAHSAPLGLSFVPDNNSWPKEYSHNLIVAFHGSWNRTTPTGYKVVRFILDNKENILKQEDFITGWLTPSGAVGRPVDIVFNNKGELYITDDDSGLIYKVIYNAKY